MITSRSVTRASTVLTSTDATGYCQETCPSQPPMQGEPDNLAADRVTTSTALVATTTTVRCVSCDLRKQCMLQQIDPRISGFWFTPALMITAAPTRALVIHIH